jgi:hypothetical protein
LRNPHDRPHDQNHQRRGGDRRRPDQTHKERLLPIGLPFARNPRPQTHVEIRGCHHGLEACNQPAQISSLVTKVAARRANGKMGRRLLARLLTAFQFVNFSPRIAALFAIHDYTT